MPDSTTQPEKSFGFFQPDYFPPGRLRETGKNLP